MMVQIASGFLDGFFGKSSEFEGEDEGAFSVRIKLDGDTSGKPIKIDVETCLANNMAFFQNIFATAATAYTNRDDLSSHESKAKTMIGEGMLMVMAQAPSALARCHV